MVFFFLRLRVFIRRVVPAAPSAPSSSSAARASPRTRASSVGDRQEGKWCRTERENESAASSSRSGRRSRRATSTEYAFGSTGPPPRLPPIFFDAPAIQRLRRSASRVLARTTSPTTKHANAHAHAAHAWPGRRDVIEDENASLDVSACVVLPKKNGRAEKKTSAVVEPATPKSAATSALESLSTAKSDDTSNRFVSRERLARAESAAKHIDRVVWSHDALSTRPNVTSSLSPRNAKSRKKERVS